MKSRTTARFRELFAGLPELIIVETPANNAHEPDHLEITSSVREVISGGLWATLEDV